MTRSELTEAGFKFAGTWALGAEPDTLRLDGPAPSAAAGVYAFYLGEAVHYIGSARGKRGVAGRLAHYERAKLRTALRVRRLILGELAEGKAVDVLTYLTPAPATHFYNAMPVDLAAGIEAGLIVKLRPLWNLRG